MSWEGIRVWGSKESGRSITGVWGHSGLQSHLVRSLFPSCIQPFGDAHQWGMTKSWLHVRLTSLRIFYATAGCVRAMCEKRTTHMVHNTSIIYLFPWFPSPLIKTRWSGGEPSTVHTKNYTKLRWPSWSDQKTHSSTNKSWPSWEVAAGPGHTVQFIQRKPHWHDQALFHGKRYIYHRWPCQGLHWGSRGDILSHNVVLATFGVHMGFGHFWR